MNRCALIMAGGTGGHVFPALALAEQLRTQGWRVVWLGTAQGMEAQWVGAAHFPLETIAMGGVRGKGWGRRLWAPFMVMRAIFQSMGAILRQRPHVVLGFGGYVALPGGLAAVLLRIPLLIHEQNAVAGLTNRLLGRLAQKVFEGFPGSFRQPSGHPLASWLGCPKVVETVGNPVRRTIIDLPEPRSRFAPRRGNLRLLVLGGSQGAQALNQWIPRALALIPPAERPTVVHQGGVRHQTELEANYREMGVQGDLRPFIEDMAAAYAECDLVICRAGALTLAELTAAGVGSVLVPYPAAVDDHQTANARFLESAGAACLWPQTQLEAAALAQWLQSQTRILLLGMADAARRLFHGSAVVRLSQVCEEVAG
ncbi:undecaprenyldiphospho-muramoylpentapeptide beta-N-acetylglucosaminyltransferase [Ferrovum sp.]|uniref:undecaprenyldiphospho-muramoylpentapeptide beta-N-acetylglucosaminyltransferase n=1 Tax=Ferrovum sp. TaxID=2609467 RepID=UPI00261D3788|nr:undecaprenyldiphospho-muramoylpentapeptide beta-N-acetylglucosaminyltransferase [Ferrovum sp.]